ncbi:MAG: peroxiredoxin [Rubrivivax sp.]
MIKVGDKLPACTIKEFVAVEGQGCAIGSNDFDVSAAAAGKTVALFAVPGAFTPTCSAQHLPGFVQHAQELREAGIDEIWCLSVNDPYVMGAWGKDQGTAGKVRMVGDGNGAFTTAAGMMLDRSAAGLGMRSARYSMLVVDGTVRTLNLEAPGKFEVSGAAALLEQARALRAG